MRPAAAIVAMVLAGGSSVVPIGDGMGGDGVDTPIRLPSGNEVRFLDVVTTATGAAGLTYRFRFVAPWVADASDFDRVTLDMAYLCEAYAIPRISNIGPQPAQIVVSLSEEPVKFGQVSPNVVQFFEAFRREDDTCVWELF